MEVTAIEWLMQNIYIDPSPELLNKFEKAKELEKQQIIDAVNSQRQMGWDEKGEHYYNQTYGKANK